MYAYGFPKYFWEFKLYHQIGHTERKKLESILYMWNYWQVEYLAICSKNAIGEVFNWWF